MTTKHPYNPQAAAAVALHEPLLAEHPVADWPAAFRLVEERWKAPGKLILALHEFQWMAAASPEVRGTFTIRPP